MIEREMLYRLLTSESARVLYSMVGGDQRMQQVRRAINWIRTHFNQPMSMTELANHAGMSQATLHRHFKASTGMSPLQYQKKLRLQDARMKLLAGAEVTDTAYAVGYESPSQFSREYARLFGRPPSEDARRLRALGASEAQISTAPV